VRLGLFCALGWGFLLASLFSLLFCKVKMLVDQKPWDDGIFK
jgi:hypothetical protein